MIPLKNKTNVIAPSAENPFGQIRNDDGSNNGTPVDQLTYNDIHVFFDLLMNEAGIVPNNLPENTTNGFQLNDAIKKLVRLQLASTTERGTVLKATQALVNTGTDEDSFVSPKTFNDRTATESRTGIAELATQAEVNTGSDTARIVTPSGLANAIGVMHVQGAQRLQTKIVDIGDWDMNANSSPASPIAHGIADFTNIREVSVMIRNDANDTYYPLNRVPTNGVTSGGVDYIDTSAIALNRTTGGAFDATGFQNTGYNRGFITITYVG